MTNTYARPSLTRRFGVLCGIVLAMGALAPAKIDLVTLPDRGEIQLTIYNPADLTLVKETRTISLKQGDNPLQFSWANTLIDPTSVHLKLTKGEDFVEVVDIAFPANTQNTLIWTLDAANAGEATFEITYFTSGIAWQADYVVNANATETSATIEGFVRVTNNSGEDYLNAETRLLVGEVNLEEAIALLANMGGMARDEEGRGGGRRVRSETARMNLMTSPAPASAPMEMMDAMAAKEVAKAAVSEYFLFSIEGREDLENNVSKRLSSFVAKEVPVVVTYKRDERKYGWELVKLYTFKNTKEQKMPDSPLPQGFWTVFSATRSDAGGLVYQGRHTDRYIPIGEKVELNLGSDGLVLYEEVVRRYKRENLNYGRYGNVEGWDIVEEREIVLRNSKREPVPVELVRLFQNGDFDITPTNNQASWTKMAETEYQVKGIVPALGELRFAYTETRRNGANAKK